MPYVPLEFPPGLYKNGTPYQARQRWYDANLIRFFEGTIRPWGGWATQTTGTITGVARSSKVWRDNSLTVWYAVGTASHLYAMSVPGTSMTDITPSGFTAGLADATNSLGFGGGNYGSGNYGSGQASSIIQWADQWSFASYGQYLLCVMPSDGRVNQWTLSGAAVVLSHAPSANAVIVTDQRIAMTLAAAGVPRRVQWADQGADLTLNASWTPSTTNQAGSYDLSTDGVLRCAKNWRGTVLLLTDVDAHLATYTADVFVYGFQKVGNGCGAISPNCMVETDDFVAWMSQGDFYTYNGYVEKLPCDVSDFLFSNMNASQASKVSAFRNSQYSEITWFYPSNNGTENDSYVTWNYRERHWTVGTINRGCGADRGPMPNPLYVGTDGYVYQHESGFNYADSGASAQVPYLAGGPFELGNGDSVMYARQLVPDDKTVGDVSVKFLTRYYPDGPETTNGPYTVSQTTDVRFSGRQARLRYDAVNQDDWRVGIPRLEVVAGGER